MISLYDYVELLKNYEKNIQNELREIMMKAKVNFTYEDIKIKSFNYGDDDNFLLDIFVKKYNGYRDQIISIRKNYGEFENLTYPADRPFSAIVFEKTVIDEKTLEKIIELAKKYVLFYHNEFNYEQVMRKVRQLPDTLPFVDREYRESERKILDETMVDINRLPKFLFNEEQKSSAK